MHPKSQWIRDPKTLLNIAPLAPKSLVLLGFRVFRVKTTNPKPETLNPKPPVTGTIRRTSSRFCLGVEHGDYNGTLTCHVLKP